MFEMGRGDDGVGGREDEEEEEFGEEEGEAG